MGSPRRNQGSFVSLATREVDWPLVEGALAIRPTVKASAGGRVQAVLLLSRSLPTNVTLLGFGFAALQGVRSVLGLERVALFLRSKSGHWLSGLVGTNFEGELVDERHLRHAVDPEDEALWEALARGRQSFEVLDNAPLVAHRGDQTQVVGRGWFVKTPILDGEEPLGFFYNDSAVSGAALDVDRQELLAAFSALVAGQLRAVRDRTWPLRLAGLSRELAECLEILAVEPSVSQADLARRVGLSDHQLGRAFRREMGVPLAQYRNELRLERFFALVEATEHEHRTASLIDLALESGFGSYSQFHRVFSARFGRSPRRYLDP
jgi:AraC-like DNA-binding protein